MGTLEDIFGAARAANAGDGGEGAAVTHDVASDAKPAAIIPTTFPMCRLANFVMDTWRVAVDHRRESGVDEKLRYALLSQTCQYNDDQKSKMRAAGIDERIFSPITATKVRAAKAMLVDIFNSTGEWPFTVEPTPDPDVPDAVAEEAVADIKIELQQIGMQLEQMGVQQLNGPALDLLNRLVLDATQNRYDEIMNRKLAFARNRTRRMER